MTKLLVSLSILIFSTLGWASLSGSEKALLNELQFQTVKLSPDGTKIAVSFQKGEGESLIVLQLERYINPFELRRGLDIKLKEFEELLRKETTGEIAA